MADPVQFMSHHTAVEYRVPDPSPLNVYFAEQLAAGRIVGHKCPECGKVYMPPRGYCPLCVVETTAKDEVEVADRGTVTTFCIVNVPFAGQRLDPPYVVAQVLLDGADIPLPHLILGCPADQVRMGLRVAAVWREPERWSTTPENIAHFEPTGEPDAPYESYSEHL